MKTKFKSTISILLATMIAVSFCAFTTFSMTGCVELDPEVDTTVYANGSSVVEYREYIYFINGLADFPSTSVKEDVNQPGKVRKGGLYRAKKQEKIWNANPTAEENEEFAKSTIDFKLKRSAMNPESTDLNWYDLRNYSISAQHEFIDGKERQHFDHSDDTTEQQIEVELMVGKIIGTIDYPGGIYIFDDRIYFGSPANSLDKEGNYQYNKIDFFSCNMDGSNLIKLYTSVCATNDKIQSIPYSFTKQNGIVYLNTYEQWYNNDKDEQNGKLTGYIKCIEISNGIMRKESIVVPNVLGVHFPKKETYNATKYSSNTINDFVYYIRQADRDDLSYGTVIEMMRPNGDDKAIVINDGKVVSIEGTSGDFLYYRNTYGGQETLEFTNLYAQLVQSSYEKENDRNGGKKLKKDKDGNDILKKGTTFVSEQKAILDGYNAWLAEPNKSSSDSRYINYSENYIGQMSEAAHILVSNISESSRTYTSFTLIPQKWRNISNIRVIGKTANALYNIGSKESFLIGGQSFTPVVTNNGIAYGYNTEGNFAYTYYNREFSGNNVAALGGNYSLVNSATSRYPLSIFPVHNERGEIIDTYASYITTYPGDKAVQYMAIIKIDGMYNAEGYFAVPLADVIPSDLIAIHCLDPECIDYTHDHSSRDGFVPGEQKEKDESGYTD